MGPCANLESEEDYNLKIDQVKNILSGNFKPVKDFIKSEMSKHAENLEFEQAEMMKEKLGLFTEYQAKSTVVSHTISDVDVFSIDSDEEWAYVNYMKVVNGALINTETMELKMNLNSDPEEILEYVIPQVREKYNSIAPEVVVPIEVDLPDAMIEVTIPQRGDKKKLLELSMKNVKYFMLQKKKLEISHVKRQTPAERILKTLQSDLNMDVVPIHLELSLIHI